MYVCLLVPAHLWRKETLVIRVIVKAIGSYTETTILIGEMTIEGEEFVHTYLCAVEEIQ